MGVLHSEQQSSTTTCLFYIATNHHERACNKTINKASYLVGVAAFENHIAISSNFFPARATVIH